jgi:diacylglycerol O-acyltransferase-1
MCGLTLPVFPISALLVEKLKLYTPISEKFVATLYLIITTAGILYPGYVIHRVQSAVLSGLILILIAVTGWMKLVSYAHTNADVWALIKAGMKQPATPETAAKVEYPENINFRNMAYFMMAPTLCYQLSYPRSNTVRKGWVLRQIGKLLVFVGLMGFITEQVYNYPIFTWCLSFMQLVGFTNLCTGK